MRLPKIGSLIVGAAALLLTMSFTSRSAEAQSISIVTKTYKVQVEYWFFDTDYYYWSTVFETDNLQDAQFVYDLLLMAKEDGQLNSAAPNSYWRYFAVDVRMITEYHYPDILKPLYYDYQPITSRLSTK